MRWVSAQRRPSKRLAWFPAPSFAVNAALVIQQRYAERLVEWPENLRMGLKIGIASGPVVQLHADAYGDSVNLAARLSDSKVALDAGNSAIQHLTDDSVRLLELIRA